MSGSTLLNVSNIGGTMSSCPYTWVVNKLGLNRIKNEGHPDREARHLNVRVVRDGEERVLVSLPAKSARWLIELIPQDVVDKIYEEKIPLEQIQKDLAEMKRLIPHKIFLLEEDERSVSVWLD